MKTRLFGRTETHGLEQRCYNAICLFAGIGCITSGLFDLLLRENWLLPIITGLSGSIFLSLYYHSSRQPNFAPKYWILITSGVILLTATWFWNGGLSGSTPVVAMVALVVLLTIVNRNPYRVVIAIFVPLMSLLILVEYLSPSLISHYSNREEQFLDLYLTYIISTFVITIVIMMILQAYREERIRVSETNQRLSDSLDNLHKANRDLERSMAKVKRLSGLLPICSHCKKVRDDKGYWNQIESYIHQHSEAEFSHGICPDCAKELYPEFDLYDENES